MKQAVAAQNPPHVVQQASTPPQPATASSGDVNNKSVYDILQILNKQRSSPTGKTGQPSFAPKTNQMGSTPAPAGACTDL